MLYATWNLSLESDGNFYDASSNEDEQVILIPIWSDGQPEENAIIMGKVSHIPNNASKWNIIEITKLEAEAFIENNFIQQPDQDGVKATTLSEAKRLLDI